MKPLYLVLKPVWYDMIEQGVKLCEYRDITPYWVKRLYWAEEPDVNGLPSHMQLTDEEAEDVCKNIHDAIAHFRIIPKSYPAITFQRAYPKDPPKMNKRIESITVGKGNPFWGAERGKEYICINLKKNEDD